MQDNASARAAYWTAEQLNAKYVFLSSLPAFSPNFNPVEGVWNSVRDFIKFSNLDSGRRKTWSLDQLRVIMKEAWDSAIAEELMALVLNMPARCQVILDTNDGFTKYLNCI